MVMESKTANWISESKEINEEFKPSSTTWNVTMQHFNTAMSEVTSAMNWVKKYESLTGKPIIEPKLKKVVSEIRKLKTNWDKTYGQSKGV